MEKNKNITVWIGKKLIFNEPSSILKNIKDTKSKNKKSNKNLKEQPKPLRTVTHQPVEHNKIKIETVSPFTRVSVNQKFFRQMSLDNMDVIPKFVSSKCMEKVNQQIMNRILRKKEVFNKISSTYLSPLNINFDKKINEISKEIESQNASNEVSKNDDFKNFNKILSIINKNNTDNELINLQKTPIEKFTKVTDEMKTKIMNGILLNGEVFSEKLHLNSVQIPKIIPNQIKYETVVRKKRPPLTLSNEQINLFKIFIGNSNIYDNQIIPFFDLNNPKVKLAGEKYFQNYYNANYLELYYYYPNKPQIGIRQHNFHFSNEISELFMAAQDDCLALGEPNLYLDDGRKIINNNKKYKCIGALYLLNQSRIAVYFV